MSEPREVSGRFAMKRLSTNNQFIFLFLRGCRLVERNISVGCDNMSEWVSECLAPTQQFVSTISWRAQVNFQWDEGDVCFALDQHP